MNFIEPSFITAAGDTTTITDVISLVPDLGVAALLLVIIYGGFKKWWVFAWTYQDLLDRHEKLRQDRDKWQDIALHSTNLVESIAKLKKDGR